jgi:putative flippase GtrA
MAPAGFSIPGLSSNRIRQFIREGWRYFAVSVVALAVDYGLLVALTERGRLHYLTASAISFTCGAVVHYALSVTLVFRTRRVADRRVEFIAFFAIGLIGLAVTQAVLAIAVEWLGLSYVVGKLAATGISFVLNFAARKAVLFTEGPAEA